MAGKGNIFRISKIYSEATININRWTLRFTGLDNILLNVAPKSPLFGITDTYQKMAGLLNGGNSVGSGSPATALEISLVSSNFPFPKLETIEIPRFNDQFKSVTKFAPMENLTVAFTDYVNGSASAILQLWRSFVGDKQTGAIGFKQDYVLPKAYFRVLGPDAPGYSDDFCDANGGPPFLQEYALVNVYPLEVNFPEHADTGDVRRVTAVFVVDNLYLNQAYFYNYASSNPADRYQSAALTAVA